MIAALLFTLSVSTADNVRAMAMLQDWVRAVENHNVGERDEPLALIGAWTFEDLDLVLPYVEALIDLPLTNNARNNSPRVTRRRSISNNDLAAIRELVKQLQARVSFDLFRKHAALLHTDVALLMSSVIEVPPPPPRASRPTNQPRAVDVMSYDGRVESFAAANPHWQFAMNSLEALPAKPSRDPLVAQWYRAIGAHFAERHSYSDAMRHFDRARGIVADDPDVLFGEACLQETLGSPRNQNFVRSTTLPNGMMFLGIDTPAVHFKRAEALLKRALSARPEFVEARLRLGRVLAAQKQFAEALPHFQQVVKDAQDPALTYFAHLFAGDAALALDRAADALPSYEQALKLQPNAQAAHLGLGAALRMLGRREAALDAVLATIAIEPRTRDSFDEPWWEYYEGDAANVVDLLAALRAPFQAGRQ
jgi:tetratricopeptide (TPR) repeat protein